MRSTGYRDDAARFARQASEQNFTSSQLFAHFLRHDIGRPHMAQGLDGRVDLFPLNDLTAGFMGRYRNFARWSVQRRRRKFGLRTLRNPTHLVDVVAQVG
jgi:hypothetical protein